MNIRPLSRFALAALTMLALFGCGGGGGDGGGGGGGGPTAVLTLALPTGTVIGGVDVTMNLPAGVTAKADTAGLPDSGIVVVSGAAAGGFVGAKYTAASGSAPGQIKIAVIKADGFNGGEFVTVNFDFTGDPPAASGFTVAALSVVDLNGVTISGLAVTPAVQIR